VKPVDDAAANAVAGEFGRHCEPDRARSHHQNVPHNDLLPWEILIENRARPEVNCKKDKGVFRQMHAILACNAAPPEALGRVDEFDQA
jgi:hypothetical protein